MCGGNVKERSERAVAMMGGLREFTQCGREGDRVFIFFNLIVS